jgi:hypothetical protein
MVFTLVLGSLVFATSGGIIHVFEKLKLQMISFSLYTRSCILQKASLILNTEEESSTGEEFSSM